MAYQLSEINYRVKTDVRGFLEECNHAYHLQVEAAAQAIAKGMARSPVVLLSGPSGSGKTTTAMKVEEQLRKIGIASHTISMDNYFMTVRRDTAPRTPEGEIDYESPFCLDMALLNRHFTKLSEGEVISIPKFEFSRQMRSDQPARPLQLKENEIAIYEGIHALNPMITGRHPEAQKMYISARSDVEDGDSVVFKRTWLRLVRRTVRDAKFRGSDAEFTLSNWANVRRGEKLYISPYKMGANIIFDSSLPYEVSVMKQFAPALFSMVHEGVARYHEFLDLTAAFDLFEPIDPALIGKDSLIREFIGGSAYKY